MTATVCVCVWTVSEFRACNWRDGRDRIVRRLRISAESSTCYPYSADLNKIVILYQNIENLDEFRLVFSAKRNGESELSISLA